MMAAKVGAGLVVAAVAGYALYVLSKEDESEAIAPALKAKVGEYVQIQKKGNGEKIESRQLIKIFGFIKELSDKKMDVSLEKKELNRDSFKQKRFDLY